MDGQTCHFHLTLVRQILKRTHSVRELVTMEFLRVNRQAFLVWALNCLSDRHGWGLGTFRSCLKVITTLLALIDRPWAPQAYPLLVRVISPSLDYLTKVRREAQPRLLPFCRLVTRTADSSHIKSTLASLTLLCAELVRQLPLESHKVLIGPLLVGVKLFRRANWEMIPAWPHVRWHWLLIGKFISHLRCIVASLCDF